MNFHLSIMSHARAGNVKFMQKFCEPFVCNWYVIQGEKQAYIDAGAHNVIECPPGISPARNAAMFDAFLVGLPSIQISDDLRNIKKIHLEEGKRKTEFVTIEHVAAAMIELLAHHKLFYGGTAVTSNPLNYTGVDLSTNKLIVCDFNCFMPGCMPFDEALKQKEDYDMTVRQLLQHGGVIRMDNILCDFPHRQNAGGANTYRNTDTEKAAMNDLLKKWPKYFKPHNTRENQVSLLSKEVLKDHKFGTVNLFEGL
jgi:hypothetical protein